MEMYNPMPPGEFIAEIYLRPKNTSARQFAKQLGVSASTVHRLLNGQGKITPEMAERLSKVLGRSVDSWIRLQEIQIAGKSACGAQLDGLTCRNLAGSC